MQPSIAAIREARRRARQAAADAPPKPAAANAAANAVTIGGSTNGTPLPPAMPGRAGSGRGSGGREQSAAMMAAKAKSTWLEDVMKTWEVKYIRESGLLEKSKEGQEISEYLNELDAEAQREVDVANIEATDRASSEQPPTEGATMQPARAMNGVSTSPDPCNRSEMSSQTSQAAPSSATPSSTPSPMSPNGPRSSRSSEPGGKPSVRTATKIAPAPNVGAALSPGVPGVPVLANGMFPASMYPGGMSPAGWPSSRPAAPGPKKRGRKRKNPELTEEERALVRKEQNRESAKLSRVRRKVIAAEYEGRLNALVGENAYLRKQVEGLNNRLVYLQSLLTVSVRQEPGPESGQQ